MQPSYQRLETTQGPAFLMRASVDAVADVDSIVFDCDGVLIDVRKSYDAAIEATADRLVRSMFNLVLPWKGRSAPLVQGLRNTGRFNSDWDTVYAIMMFIACSLPEDYAARLPPGSAERQSRIAKVSEAEVAQVFSRALKMVNLLSKSSADSQGESAAEVVWSSLAEERRGLCTLLKEYLGYPGNPPSSLLASLFDEVYHGGALYSKMYGAEPRYHQGPGFIEHDRIIVRPSDLASLSKTLRGRLAMATGRPKMAAEYTLGELMSYFAMDASVFIGDGDVRPTPEAESFKKPSGKSLLFARERMHSKNLAYVGDSAEDLQMVWDARKSVDSLTFVGIYANAYEPANQLRYFKQQGAELILPSVKAMTRVMNEVASR